MVYKKDQKALSKSDGSGNGKFVEWANATGVYTTTDGAGYAKLNGAGNCDDQTDFEVFLLVKYLEHGGKTYGTDKSEIFESFI